MNGGNKLLENFANSFAPVESGFVRASSTYFWRISDPHQPCQLNLLLIFLCIANDKTSGRNETDRRLSRSRAFSSFDLFKTDLVSSLSHFRAIWAASSPFHYGFAIEPRRGRSINPAVTGRKSAVKRVRIERERIDYMQLKLDPLLDNNLDLLIIIQP